jgi:hypothetical protein
MNTQTNPTPDTTAAPSVTIAPRNPAKGVLVFIVTLTTIKDTRSYPCRSLEKAVVLAQRFVAGVTSGASAKEVVTKDVAQPKPAQ